MPTASRQKASRLLCCSSSFISACAVLSPTAASITGPTLNADPIAGSRRPIIVPMQQSRKSSICSPPLDAGLPLLESFSQTSAGLESRTHVGKCESSTYDGFHGIDVLDQLDRLTERWVADHLQKGKTSKKDKELVTLEYTTKPQGIRWHTVRHRRHLGKLERTDLRRWIRTFAIITTDANELVATIHDRMPLILAPSDYLRWLGAEPDPRDLMRPFPSD